MTHHASFRNSRSRRDIPSIADASAEHFSSKTTTRTRYTTMRYTFGIFFTLLSSVVAFQAPLCSFQKQSVSSSRWMAAVELEPEPEGGEEITPRASMPGCRMKNMGPAKDCSSDDGEPFNFWMTGQVDGALIKEVRTQVLKDAAKKAQFPGFRKGQIPPYAQPQITNFAVEESIIKTVETAIEAYGLRAVSGSDGQLTVHEDVAEISKGYTKIGESLQFTASFNGVFEAGQDDDVVEASGVVDVEATSAE